MKQLDKSFWEGIEEVTAASARGFNPLREIPRALEKEFPDYLFGWFTEGDLSLRQADRWVGMKPEWFNREAFNSTIGMRYGVVERDGGLWFNELMLCVMPKDFHERLMDKINEKSEEIFSRSILGEKAAPTEQSVGVEPAYEEKQVTATLPPEDDDEPPPPKKRGPGRPRKVAQ